MTATGSAATVTTINIGAAASADAGVVIQASNSITANAVACAATKSAFILQASATLNAAAFTAAANVAAAISFQASSSASVAASSTVAMMHSLTLNAGASLTLSGQGTVAFPDSSSQAVVDSTATIKCAGGVVVYGALGAASFTVGGVTKASSTVQVKAQAYLNMTGNIAGSASANLQVYGQLNFGGATITTSLDIQGASSSTTTNNGVLHITATTFTASGSSTSVTGSGVIRIDNPSTTIAFGKVAACDATSFIDVKVASVASVGTTTSGVAMTFDASATTRSAMLCDVRLYDTSGNTLVLTNSNKIAMGGRRLLSSGSSTWSSSGQVTYTTGGNAAGHGATASFVLLAASAIFAAVGARIF